MKFLLSKSLKKIQAFLLVTAMVISSFSGAITAKAGPAGPTGVQPTTYHLFYPEIQPDDGGLDFDALSHETKHYKKLDGEQVSKSNIEQDITWKRDTFGSLCVYNQSDLKNKVKYKYTLKWFGGGEI